jgi:hypothetical protein
MLFTLERRVNLTAEKSGVEVKVQDKVLPLLNLAPRHEDVLGVDMQLHHS